MPLIERYVVPGSIIHSDQWASHMGGAITAIPVIPSYIHNSVNHHHNFCPQDGTRTNDVECFWKNMKMKFKAMSWTHCWLGIWMSFFGDNIMEIKH